ncbi:MAG: DNA mismatch repair protein MutS [Flavobacteriaceae bacterium]|nr:DNA mismatch repair protein MutS [Flavobacteriaceae bacterium]
MKKDTKKITPLMQQYNAIKAKYPDAMLLFRVGDFYETFGEDAIQASKILDIILTKRGAGSQSETELAGFPHHSLNLYLPKLVKAGLRVAICDQLEDPKKTKKIVKRGVTELITPGLASVDGVLNPKSNNFLASVFISNNIGISFLDISTGEFLISQGDSEYIAKLLANFNPSEILISKQHKKKFKEIFGELYNLFFLEQWIYNSDFANELILKQFETKSLKGFGINDLNDGIISTAGILHYLSETQHHKLNHITGIKRIPKEGHVWLDRFTVRNLEIFYPNSTEGKSLIDIIDRTISPMGGRLLKRWLALPSTEKKLILQRHNIVQYFIDSDKDRELLIEVLNSISDLERLVSKISTKKISPRELFNLNESLKTIKPISKELIKTDCLELNEIIKSIQNCDKLINEISNTLSDSPPVNINKGNSISSEFSTELMELRSLSKNNKDFLDQMLKEQSEATNIPSLKISSNNVFGYYIEVRNTHREKVPEDWIRKQTLVNAERYINEELKEYESKILGAEQKIMELELMLYDQLLDFCQSFIRVIQNNSKLIAELDCLLSFSVLAISKNYVKPIIDDSLDIEIINGKHPVIESQLPIDKPFIPNSIHLNSKNQQIIMITGPNMSGKSAILRQTAIICLLAQIGCFVPAEKLRMGIIDKIFTRVGASDNISMGESTFMVEMNETALILNNISDRSLILLDEIGRGTSTYDGISIAWAITEYLHDHKSKPKTLFATHYHELNQMEESFDRIKNFNVSIKEENNQILFLRNLVPGSSEHSFGIHVAKMAGIPNKVLDKANEMLKQLELSRSSKELVINKISPQLDFFNISDPLLDDLKKEVEELNLDELTPIEALLKLNELKRKINK